MSFGSYLGGPGHDSYNVPLELFQENRRKLADRLAALALAKKKEKKESENDNDNANANNIIKKYVVVMKGGPSPTRYDTDNEPIFRQESYFWWLTGVKEPDCSLVITIDCSCSVDVDDDADDDAKTPKIEYALFVPKLPASYATMMGKIRTLEEWKHLYGVDGGVYFNDDLENFVEERVVLVQDSNADKTTKSAISTSSSDSSSRVLLMCGQNTDSGMMYEERMPEVFSNTLSKALTSTSTSTSSYSIIDTTTLFPILADCRVYKSKLELQLLEHVAQITSFAHAYVMRNIKPGMYEYQCESLFKHYSYYNYGSRLQSYTNICGCGPNAAILHYGHTGEPNASLIQEKDNCLFDMVSLV